MIALRKYLPLLWRLTVREWEQRYAGSALGLLWTWAGPLLQLGIFSFVFGQVFRGRIEGLGTDNYTAFVALGLWPWLMFSDGLLRGALAVSSNGNMVKKVAFPHWVLVASAVSAAFLAHLCGFAAVLVALSLLGQAFRLDALPAVLLTLCCIYLLTVGLASLFAAIQVFVRDTEHALTPALVMLQYLTPVLYPITLIPEPYRGWLAWNPMGGFVEVIRAALLPATSASIPIPSLPLIAFALVMLVIGLSMLRRLSPHFEDYL